MVRIGTTAAGALIAYAAAIEVIQTHHAVDVGIVRQQVAFNEFHHVIDHARNAVHAGGDTQQILVPTLPSALR